METRIVTVTAENVDRYGFFCFKSKAKAEGYQRKRQWLMERFAEGMQIKLLYEGERSVGFVEFMPGESTWRVVNAPDYLVIHCLWVVGTGKGKGNGSRLLEVTADEARQQGKQGIAMVTSTANGLADKKILLKNGFEEVDQAPPNFSLLAKKFDSAPTPTFPTNWQERLQRCGQGMTALYTAQCPYIVDMLKGIQEITQERGLPFQTIELTSSQAVQDNAPSPYGIFNLVYNGRLLTHYVYGQKHLLKLLDESAA